MKKYLICLLILLAGCQLSAVYARTVTVKGNFCDRRTTQYLPGVKVRILTPDSTFVVQTIADQREITTKHGDWTYLDTGKFTVALKDSLSSYILEGTMEDYEPIYYNIDLSTLGKKEYEMKIPPLYMRPLAKATTLDDFVVKATKIKFYHKGDTIVYNADAFDLPEGSMLDALIAQLPGVEIKDGGKIYVNGKFVESMLLNGKDFFKGNQQVLRDNLGAYTVKNIEVYEKYNELSQLMGKQIEGDSEFVMDIKLKKDYMTGFMGNITAGYGTQGRYTGRLFSMLFTNNASFAVYGNVNNLNEESKPGSRDGYGVWIEPQPGTTNVANGGFDYSVESPRKVWSLSGNVNAIYTDNFLTQNQLKETFIPGGNSYQTSLSNNRKYELNLSTSHLFRYWKDRFYWRIDPDFTYRRSNGRNNNLSATFNENIQDRYEVDSKLIEALYNSDNPDDLKKAIVNRNNFIRNNRANTWRAHVYNETSWKIPQSPDAVTVWIEGSYDRQHSWNQSSQLLDMGYYSPSSQPNTSLARRNTTINYPFYDFYAKGAARYYINRKDLNYSFCYEYRHEQTRKTNEEFMFEELAEHREALIPDIYTEIADLPNSSRSKQINNIHKFKAKIDYVKKNFSNDWKFSTGLSVEYHIMGRHMDYMGYAENASAEIMPVFIPISRVRGKFQDSRAYLQFTDESSNYKSFSLRYDFQTSYAPLQDMIDLPNTSDPLNLYIGNPNLKDASIQEIRLNIYTKLSRRFSMGFNSFNYYRSNYVIRGYTYFPETGVREYRSDNMSGVITTSSSFYCNETFGRNDAFNLYGSLGYDFNRFGNLVGVDGPAQKQIVYGSSINGRLNLGYTLMDKLNLTVGARYSSDYSHSATTSTRTQSVQPSINVFYKFPLGFEANAGYAYTKMFGLGDKALRDHYNVLSAQINYRINNNWTVSIIGNDLLNVGSTPRIVNDMYGRTETLVNSLPRYVMCSVTYKFNTKSGK